MLSTQPTVSLQEFLQSPQIEESPAWEFLEGCMTQKPMPTFYHSLLQKKLITLIDNAGSDYEAFPELRCVLPEQSVVPDIVVLHRSSLPKGNGVVNGAPDWLIEILSPDQSTTKLIAKIQLCLTVGCRLAWLVDPYEKIVLVFRSTGDFSVITEQQALPTLNEINIQIIPDTLWQWLDN